MGMKVTDYYLGLDMGTSSVGWAVTDIHYKLLRAKGKDLWGVRLFDEAETAVKEGDIVFRGVEDNVKLQELEC